MADKVTVKNIADIKSTPKTTLLIHMTKAQWGHATKGLPVVDRVPGRGAGLLCVPNPDGDIVAQPFCHEEGPDTQCMIKQTFRGGQIVQECRCRPRRAGGGGGGTLPTRRGTCALALNASARPLFRCESVDCGGNCRLTLARIPFGQRTVFIITCECSG